MRRGQVHTLPPTFKGSHRWYKERYRDAMAIVTHVGHPDLFLTFTCNPKWPGIQQYVEQNGGNTLDYPDLCCSVFQIKLRSLLDDILKKHIFGNVAGLVMCVEFQKRGLPHVHMLINRLGYTYLTTALTGITAQLIPAGRTLHSPFQYIWIRKLRWSTEKRPTQAHDCTMHMYYS